MSAADQRAQLNEVTVLIGLVKMIVDSDTLLSPAALKLTKDIDKIPGRFAAVLSADRATRRTWKRERPQEIGVTEQGGVGR